MNTLVKRLLSTIGDGLQKHTLTTCSRWTEQCRIMGNPFPGPWTFKYHPWCRAMHDSDAELNIGQKGAQLAYTETVLNRAFFTIDIKQIDTLYVLPAKTPDASDFSAARFDTALELSPYLTHMFSDVKNIGHKRAGAVNLYLRGSRSRSGLKSIPCGFIAIDELDEMDQRHIPLVMERQSGQIYKQTWMISTPTVDGFGINVYFLASSMEDYFFVCPHCSRHTRLIFPDCIIITADDYHDPNIKNTHLICKECKHPLDHKNKPNFLADGEWVPANTKAISRGFHISQLYSSTVKPWELATSYLKALTNPADEQEFYNSKLGLAHLVEGARVLDTEIIDAIGNYKNGIASTSKDCIITIGIDVGKWLHYLVVEWSIPPLAQTPDINMSARGKVLEVNKCLHFEEIDNVIFKHRPNMSVIDAHPEKRKAYELAQRFWHFIKLCYYGNNVNGKQIHIGKDDMEQTVTVDRTSWFDLSLGRFHNSTISLPLDTPLEAKEHFKVPSRVYEKDKNNNPIGKYVSSRDDHYAHALNYAEIALAMALGLGTHEDIKSPI